MGGGANPGWGGLGQVLAGGGAGGAKAGYEGQKDRATLDELLAKAKIKQDEAMQREQLKDALASGDENRILETVMRGGMGSDYNAGMSGLQTGVETGMMRRAEAAGTGGNVPLMNVLGSARTGNPLEQTQVSGNTVFNPNLGPEQDLVTTMVGQSLADKNNRWAPSAGAAAKPPRDFIQENIIKRDLDAVDFEAKTSLENAKTHEERVAIYAERDKAYNSIKAKHGQLAVRPGDATSREDFIKGVEADQGAPLTLSQQSAIRQDPDGSWLLGTPLSQTNADAADAVAKGQGAQQPADVTTRDGTKPQEVVDPSGNPMGFDLNEALTAKPFRATDPVNITSNKRKVSGKPSATQTSKQPPVDGARKAKDGNWYIPDPSRPGKYLGVDG
ncbi:MAG: hypothetical protein M3Q96_03290 [Pseudomonadota bacterium]|nr:hypothetical protein [Pseudomonadota bacterium]